MNTLFQSTVDMVSAVKQEKVPFCSGESIELKQNSFNH